MKSIYTYLLLSFFLFSCTSDDDTQCLTILPISSNLFIELVNAQGENLIENGTYISNDITIDFNGGTFENVVFTNVPGIENFIAVGVSGEDGDNMFKINLSDIESDTLLLNLTKQETEGPCSQVFFSLHTAMYNDDLKNIQDYGGDFLITIVKE